MTNLSFVNARLIDGTGKEPRDGWGLVTAGERIQEVGPSNTLRVPSGTTVIDVGGRTLMPGLIDAHTHLTYHRSEFCLLLQQLTEPLEMTTIKAIENARNMIETGCTAIGDGGGRGCVAVAIREGVRQGLFPGPKVVAAGQIIGDTGGVWEFLAGPGGLTVAVSGPHQVRAVVRTQINSGVDWVKLAASGVPGELRGDGHTPALGYEELVAGVSEAARFGRPALAHAHDPVGIKNAVRAGVLSVHSGEFAEEEGLELMKEKGCVFLPTIAWLHYRINESYAREYLRASKLTEERVQGFIEDCREAFERCRDAIRKARKIGTLIGVGSDGAHVFPPFDVAQEMAYLQDEGLPALEVISAATKISAKALGREDVWGTLEPGKAADVLVVNGDPSKDVRLLLDKSRLFMIVRDGKVHKNTLNGAASNR